MEFESPVYENNTIVNVTNFGVSMTNDRLKKIFEKYGSISSYGIMNDDEPWRRFAYIAFEDSDAADEAVIELNGQKIDDDRRIRVRRTRKRNIKRSKPTSWSRAPGTIKNDVAEATAASNSNKDSPKDRDDIGFTVYVENLEKSLDREQLRRAFESYGTIIEARIIMEGEGTARKSRGYGFVTFTREEDAKKAIKEKSGRLIGTQIVRVEMSHGKNRNNATGGALRRSFTNHTEAAGTPDRASSSRRSVENPPKSYLVCVRNLDKSINHAQLREAFESCGEILYAKINIDREGSRGFGFVEFATEEAAIKAINEKSGSLIGTQRVRVEMSRGYDKNVGPHPAAVGTNQPNRLAHCSTDRERERPMTRLMSRGYDKNVGPHPAAVGTNQPNRLAHCSTARERERPMTRLRASLIKMQLQEDAERWGRIEQNLSDSSDDDDSLIGVQNKDIQHNPFRGKFL